MEEQEDFIEKVMHLFMEHGAKTLTMDEIAQAFSMSKKTLYQLYKNKEILLIEVLDNILKKLLKDLGAEEQTELNAIEKMLFREGEMGKFSEKNKTAFIRQLIKYYPNVYAQHVKKVYGGMSELLIENVKKGRKQGLYRTDFDEVTYVNYFMELMFAFDNSPIDNGKEGTERAGYCASVIEFYLQAITTDKGKNILKELI